MTRPSEGGNGIEENNDRIPIFVQRAAAIRAEEKRRDADSRYNNMGQVDRNSKPTKGRRRSSTCSASQQRDSHGKWKKKRSGEDVIDQEKWKEECETEETSRPQARRFSRRKKFRIITSRNPSKSIRTLSSDMWNARTNSNFKKDKIESQSQNSDDFTFERGYFSMSHREQADPNLDDSPSSSNSTQSTSRDFFPMGKIETDQTAVKVLETPSQRAANLIERFNREIHKLEYPSSAQHCTKQQSVELSLKEELNSTAHTFNISSKKCEEEKMKLPNFTLPSHFICPRDERNTISRNTSPESPKFGPKTMVLSYCSQPVMVKETTSSSALTIISNDDLNPPESNNTMNKNKTVKVNPPSLPKHQIENILSGHNERDQQGEENKSAEQSITKNKDAEFIPKQSVMSNLFAPDSNNSNQNDPVLETRITQLTWKLPNLHLFADLSLTPEKFALYCQTATVLVSDINNVLELNSKNKLINSKRSSIQKLLDCLITIWIICRRVMGIMVHPDGIATAEKTLDAIHHVRNELINIVLMVKDGTARDEFFTKKLDEIDCYVNREKDNISERLTTEFKKLSPDGQKDLHLFISSIDMQRERAYHIYKQELNRCADLQKHFLLWSSYNARPTTVQSRGRLAVEAEPSLTVQYRARKRPNENIWSSKQFQPIIESSTSECKPLNSVFDQQRVVNACDQIASRGCTPMVSSSTLQNTMTSSAVPRHITAMPLPISPGLTTCEMTQLSNSILSGLTGHQQSSTTHPSQYPYTFFDQGVWPLYFCPQLLNPLLSNSFLTNLISPQPVLHNILRNHDSRLLGTEHSSPPL